MRQNAACFAYARRRMFKVQARVAEQLAIDPASAIANAGSTDEWTVWLTRRRIP
jgi:hypothetical protein